MRDWIIARSDCSCAHVLHIKVGKLLGKDYWARTYLKQTKRKSKRKGMRKRKGRKQCGERRRGKRAVRVQERTIEPSVVRSVVKLDAGPGPMA